MKCKGCGESIIEIMAGSPRRLMWLTHPHMDPWCGEGDSATRHVPNRGVPDLQDSEAVTRWLTA